MNVGSIFVSYSSEDNYMSMRVYNDLRRSGLNVWRYERNGTIWEDFVKEITREIQACSGLLLLDSSFARKSKYVKYEVGLALKLNKPVYIALIEEDGGTWRQQQIFKDQNQIVYVDLSTKNVFDPLCKYAKGIDVICQKLGASFVSWSNIPRQNDFEKEVFALDNLGLEDREFLLSDYRNFSYLGGQRSVSAKTRLDILMEDCRRKRWQISSLYMAKGIFLLEDENYAEAITTFGELACYFPDDPRSHAGVGAAYFYRKEYSKALSEYELCHRLVEQHSDNPNHTEHLTEIVYNKIVILIQLERYNEAFVLFEKITPDKHCLPELVIAKINLLLSTGWFPLAIKEYSLLNYLYEGHHLNTHKINHILAELEWRLSELYSKIPGLKNSVFHMERYHLLSPSIRSKAQLAYLYKPLNKPIKQLLFEGLALKPESKEDWYFNGQLHFLNRNYDAAKASYKKSNSTWPYYDKLIE